MRKHGTYTAAVLLGATLGSTALVTPAWATWPQLPWRASPQAPQVAVPDVVLVGKWSFDKTETAIQGQYCNGTGRVAAPSSGSGVLAKLWSIPYLNTLLGKLFTKPQPVVKAKPEAGEVTFKVAGFREFGVVATLAAPGQPSRLTIRRDTETVTTLPMQRGRLYPVTVDLAGAQTLTLQVTDTGTLFCGPELRRREGRS